MTLDSHQNLNKTLISESEMMIWVDCYCWFYRYLSLAQQHTFKELLLTFISDTKFEGVGIEITNEMKIAIGGWAVLLVINLPLNITWYKQIERISIYQGKSLNSGKALGQLVDGVYYCHLQFAWEEVKNSSTMATVNSNTILHEFAHALDSIDRSIDGKPNILISKEKQEAWNNAFSREYIHNQPWYQHKKLWNFFKLERWNKFDPADSSCVDVAEVFSVATEFFFEKPEKLLKHSPKIYKCLKSLYRFDPVKDFPKEQTKRNLFKSLLSKLI